MGMNWSKVGKAEIFERGSYLDKGNYKLTLLKCYTMTTRKKKDVFIAELKVEESSNDEIPVGSKRSWYQDLSDEDIAFPAIKEFFMYLMQIDRSDKEAMQEFSDGLEELLDEVTDEDWKNKSEEDHPLHGTPIAVECYMKETQKGNDFTVHDWEIWDGEL